MTGHLEVSHRRHCTWVAFAASVLLMRVCVAQANDAASAAEQDVPTVEQLVTLVKAGYQQYGSVSFEYEVRTYDFVGSDFSDAPSSVIQMLIRRQGDRALAILHWIHNESIAEPDAMKSKTKNSYADGPEGGRRLTEHTDRLPRGRVRREQYGASTWGGRNPLDATYLGFVNSAEGDPFTSQNSTVKTDTEGRFRLTRNFEDGETSWTIVVDPTHGYLPVRQEAHLPGTEPFVSYNATELKEVSKGLWLPSKYTFTTSPKPGGSLEVVTVTQARVNVQLTEEELSFVFPLGTRVRDEISGRNYTIGGLLGRILGRPR